MSAHHLPHSPEGTVAARRFRRRPSKLRVLVVSPCGFVRLALAQRLANLDTVLTLAVDRGDLALDGYDAVIVGPYLDSRDRDRLVDELSDGGSDTAVIEICDPPEQGSARLVTLGHRRLAHVAEMVLAAVGEPRAALQGA